MLNEVQINSVISAANGRIRCAIYARYSSDKQKGASIDVQIRNCRAAAARKGWEIVEEAIFSDEEKSGTTLFHRPGFEQLMICAKSKPKLFEYILFDDPSRMSRNTADALKTIEILNHHRVYALFVEDDLDSKSPWFDEVFPAIAQRHAKFSKTLGYKIKGARVDLFEKGYNPGGDCYGYENVREEDPSRRGLYGHPAILGMRQVVLAEEAAIVVRVFEMYASGRSLLQIATILNDERVPTSQNPRTRRNAAWCKTAIREILRNERYCGRTYWGRTVEDRDPETGNKTRSDVSEDKWKRKELPHLRIVSDELFAQVQEQFVRATRGFGVKRLGGMTRTEACRKYLFSGLLKCGLCGANMTITTTNPARYGCRNHRESKTCSNKATILLKILEDTFIAALSDNLKPGLLQEDVVQGVMRCLKEAMGRSRQQRLDAELQQDQMEATRRKLSSQMENVVSAVRECGHSRSLLAELKEIETKIDRIDETLASTLKPPTADITELEVRSFIANSASSLAEILAGSPETVRHELQKRMTSITLTPSQDERGLVYQVSGDVSLFSSPEGVLQSNQVLLCPPYNSIT
ncbi:recombinase family protein [Granulicella aggregans]|uniref:recombinase family protein n=1 Tax=Granulicella aggregans TaxID=474949 RepID=UPI0021DF58AD|nr:recombinase family protein [Granulicella aggregans]